MKRKKTVDPNQLELALSFSPALDSQADTKAEAKAGTEDVKIVTALAQAATPLPLPPVAETPAETALPAASEPAIQQPRFWSDGGWTARVMKNDHGDGWVVEMTKEDDVHPSLVAPWSMDGSDGGDGRPKALDAPAFGALIKNAAAERRKREQQLHALLHQSIKVATKSAFVTVTLDISPDEDNATATLTAYDEFAVQLAQVRVAPSFKLNKTTAAKWVDSRFRRPER